MPGWLVTLLADGRIAGAVEGEGAGKTEREGFAEETRNTALTRVGGLLRRLGLAPGAIEAALLAVNEDEIRRLARGLGRYAPGALPPHRVRRPVLSVEVKVGPGRYSA